MQGGDSGWGCIQGWQESRACDRMAPLWQPVRHLCGRMYRPACSRRPAVGYANQITPSGSLDLDKEDRQAGDGARDRRFC